MIHIIIKLLILIICIQICGCKNDRFEFSKSHSFVPSEESEDNSEAMVEIQLYFDELNKINQNSPEFKQHQMVDVKVHDEIAKLFEPGNNIQCDLPKKIKDKIDNTENWTPDVFKIHLNTIPENGKKSPNVSVMTYLNTIKIKPISGKEYTIEITSASNINALSLINLGKTNFSYSLDCAGYLNAALSFNAGGEQAKIKASAKTSLTNSSSFFIVRAHVLPPIVEAVRKLLGDKQRMEKIHAFSFLHSVKKELRDDANNEDILSIAKELDLLWYSNSGNSNFNGVGSLGGGVNAFGVNFMGNASGEISRSSNFNAFDVIILNNSVTSLSQPIKVGEINAQLKHFTSIADFIVEPHKINNDIEFTLSLPTDLASEVWEIVDYPNVEIIATKSIVNEVKFRITGLQNNVTSFTIKTKFKDLELKRVVNL